LAFATGIKGSISFHKPSGKSSMAIEQLPFVGMCRPFHELL
jgi:hypothetical protein